MSELAFNVMMMIMMIIIIIIISYRELFKISVTRAAK